MVKAKNTIVPAKTAVPSTKSAPVKRVSAKAKAVSILSVKEKTGEELVVESFATMSRLVETLGVTLELLTQKAESMAHHIIATEQLLAELITDNGINLARVNARIRLKIASGTDSQGDPSKAIDIAASIASPLPRR